MSHKESGVEGSNSKAARVADLKEVFELHNDWMLISELAEIVGLSRRRINELLVNGERGGVIEVLRDPDPRVRCRYQWAGYSTKAARDCAEFWDKFFQLQPPDFPASMIVGKTEHLLDVEPIDADPLEEEEVLA